MYFRWARNSRGEIEIGDSGKQVLEMASEVSTCIGDKIDTWNFRNVCIFIRSVLF
jgi:hypothetical protein